MVRRISKEVCECGDFSLVGLGGNELVVFSLFAHFEDGIMAGMDSFLDEVSKSCEFLGNVDISADCFDI